MASLLRAASVVGAPTARRFAVASHAMGLSRGAPKSWYIQRAAAEGSGSLLGPFQSTGDRFDSVLRGMECVKVEEGYVECRITVADGVKNAYGTMHGGCTATLVDVLGTMALLSKDPKRPGVSVEMSQTFLAPAKGDEVITVTGTVTKYGRALGFTEVRLMDAAGKLLATGRHTKAFPQKS